ncbi:MAG: hypothetical protein FNP40_13890 [Dehalobacter sp. 4CP]|uniref:uroporphyrinogen decarboxylase family protein n=1 Tax=Dehalobacter sp. CP TaxID=2594474 RepID=UPI0013CCD54E|nr:hypothetical protein [Dehalobacter sp. 4CP]
MNSAELFRERVKIGKETIRKEKRPSRVLVFGTMVSWFIFDQGYKLSEAYSDDFSVLEKISDQAQARYNFDGYTFPVIPNSQPLQKTLGVNNYIINDKSESYNRIDVDYMDFEDYDVLIEDPAKFFWSKYAKRKFPILESQDGQQIFMKSLHDFQNFFQYNQNVERNLIEKHGVPMNSSPAAMGLGGYWPLHEVLMHGLRGIKGVSTDMRKDPVKVKAACDRYQEVILEPMLQQYKATASKGTDENCYFDIKTGMLSYSVLNPKQFEMVYWPSFKRLIDVAVEMDKLVYIFSEAGTKRLWDFFREIPKGRIALYCEMDDIFEMKKALPNVTLMGGMPLELLGNGTPEQCVDYAKKLVDELGYDGGYIFGTNKQGQFRKDAKRENLEAVIKFVQEYK